MLTHVICRMLLVLCAAAPFFASVSPARALSPRNGSLLLSGDALYELELRRGSRSVPCGRIGGHWRAGSIIQKGPRAGYFLSFKRIASNYRRIARQHHRRSHRSQAMRAFPKAARFSKQARKLDRRCAAGAPPDQAPAPAPTPAQLCTLRESDLAEDVSNPTTVIGNGTPQSCTSDAFVNAVAKGGVITFDCGPDPVTITLTRTAKVFNDRGPEIVIDGGNKITLSGGGVRRILYQNTCDPKQVWTTPHCQNQNHPRLTVQNITFVDGNSKGDDPDGGGAIWVRGGLFKVVNARFYRNGCDNTGPDVGGGAIRVFSMYNNTPVPIVNSIFGGEAGQGNVCSNGGALSSIGVSFRILNSHFKNNKAIGRGANPARSGTPGGGSGGAIYNDGNEFHLSVCGSEIRGNTANEGGGAIFFVSNDRTGTLTIRDSILRGNPSAGFETKGLPGIFVLARSAPAISNSVLE